MASSICFSYVERSRRTKAVIARTFGFEASGAACVVVEASAQESTKATRYLILAFLNEWARRRVRTDMIRGDANPSSIIGPMVCGVQPADGQRVLWARAARSRRPDQNCRRDHDTGPA